MFLSAYIPRQPSMVSTLPFASRYQLLKIFCLKHWVFQIGSTGPWNNISRFSNWTKNNTHTHKWFEDSIHVTCLSFKINFPWCSRCLEVRLHRIQRIRKTIMTWWFQGCTFFRMGDVCSTFECICIYIYKYKKNHMFVSKIHRMYIGYI